MNKTVSKIELCDNEISYLIRKGGDQHVLFIHGVGCSKESFIAAFEGNFFKDEYSLLAPDLLGHGNSSKPKDFSYTLEKQSNLVAELLKELEFTNLHIVAHSMGGAIALLLIDKLREVNSFFCLEGNLVPEDCKISRIIASFEEKEFVNNLFLLAPSQFCCRGLVSYPAASPEAFYRSSKSVVYWSFEGDLLEKYKNLVINKAYFYGEENSTMPILSKLTEQDVVQINGCGHFMMLDNPKDTYNEIIKRL